MNDKKQQIKQALKKYYTDKSLSGIQLEVLQKTLDQQGDVAESDRPAFNKVSIFGWVGSVAASLLLIALVSAYFQTPDLIFSAYADIYKDKNLNNGMQPSMQQWLDENGIASVPQQYPVEMSKFCRLDQILTTHIRIAGVEQGEMNVFFHQGERPLHWRDQSGVVEDMNWKLVKVRKNLTLLVLYSHDMREKSVQSILDKMLATA